MNRYLMLVVSLSFSQVLFSQPAPLSIDVTETAVTVTNVPPGETVALLTCARGVFRGRTHISSGSHIIEDTDADGIVQFSPPSGVPPLSVWVAVHQLSGATAAGAAPDVAFTTRTISRKWMRPIIGDPPITGILYQGGGSVFYVVHPSQTVTRAHIADGSSFDGDAQSNGSVDVDFEASTPFAPLESGDVLVIIDTSHFDVATALIGQ